MFLCTSVSMYVCMYLIRKGNANKIHLKSFFSLTIEEATNQIMKCLSESDLNFAWQGCSGY